MRHCNKKSEFLEVLINMGFSYSILEKTALGMKIQVYLCDISDIDRLQKALHSYDRKIKKYSVLIKDYMETSWSNIDNYIKKKKEKGISIKDPSFKRGNYSINKPMDILPLEVKI